MSAANPTYADVIAMLNTLVPMGDQNIDDAPHQAFWRTLTRDAFVNFDTSVWEVAGTLVKPGNPDASNFYLALAGKSPFDGSMLPRMPDTNSDLDAHPATPDELMLVAAWIRNGAPA